MRTNYFLLVLLFTSNVTFPMEFLMGWFGLKPSQEVLNLQTQTKNLREESDKLAKQLQELSIISENFVAMHTMLETNSDKINVTNADEMIPLLESFSQDSIRLSTHNIDFMVSQKDSVLEFRVKNTKEDTVLFACSIDRELHDSQLVHALHSQLTDYFDASLFKITKENEGFVKFFKDKEIAQRYPNWIANIKPHSIEPSKSYDEAVHRMQDVILQETSRIDIEKLKIMGALLRIQTSIVKEVFK